MQGTKMISTSLAEDAFGGKLELYSGLQIIFKRYMHKNCLESQYITPIFMYTYKLQLGGYCYKLYMVQFVLLHVRVHCFIKKTDKN